MQNLNGIEIGHTFILSPETTADESLLQAHFRLIYCHLMLDRLPLKALEEAMENLKDIYEFHQPAKNHMSLRITETAVPAITGPTSVRPSISYSED